MTEAAPSLEHAEPALRLRGVGRRFGGLVAVSDVDLEVAHGERRAILGPNGAGKTTLFNVIAGDIPPVDGQRRAVRRGRHRACRRGTAHELGLARTYQQSRMLLGLTVEDSIYLSIARHGGRPAPAGRSPAGPGACVSGPAQAARRVAIDHKLDELVGNLSHGEHRQVAIAMALASEPRLLMLDEPASGLSRGERQLLTELLLGLDREITLILIEHDMDVALRVAEQVTMMHDGRVIVEGTPDEIRANTLVHDLYLGPRATTTAAEWLRRCSRSRASTPSTEARRRSHDVTFSMDRESVAIVGRNGMGKTTLCAAIMGFAPPRATGSVGSTACELAGQARAQDRARRASATSHRAAGCSRRSRSTST